MVPSKSCSLVDLQCDPDRMKDEDRLELIPCFEPGMEQTGLNANRDHVGGALCELSENNFASSV